MAMKIVAREIPMFNSGVQFLLSHLVFQFLTLTVLQLAPADCQLCFSSSMQLLVLGSSIFPKHLIKLEEL
jgi:hypothetical protein